MAKRQTKEGKSARRWTIHHTTFVVLLLIVLLLLGANLAKARGYFIPVQPVPLVQGGTVSLGDLSLEQKLAQMVVVHGGAWNMPQIKGLQFGGIHLYALADEELYRQTISQFQEGMVIPFLVTVDLEGCQNPFAAFRAFPAASSITTQGEAFEKGASEGKYLSGLGITLNYAPVVDLKDTIWRCRSFPGTAHQIAELAEAYVLGLQNQGILATAKHYPGKTLIVGDPHKYSVAATIADEDILPYRELFDTVKSMMVSHLVVSGAVDSLGVPSVASPTVVGGLRQGYSGLIISDEINMLGLRNYFASLDELYLGVLQGGSDIILNFNEDPNELYHMIEVWREAVESGAVSEERIDASVKKILEAKGLNVVE